MWILHLCIYIDQAVILFDSATNFLLRTEHYLLYHGSSILLFAGFVQGYVLMYKSHPKLLISFQ